MESTRNVQQAMKVSKAGDSISIFGHGCGDTTGTIEWIGDNGIIVNTQEWMGIDGQVRITEGYSIYYNQMGQAVQTGASAQDIIASMVGWLRVAQTAAELS